MYNSLRYYAKHPLTGAIVAGSLFISYSVLLFVLPKPLPILTVKHKTIDEDTWVDVHIEQGSSAQLRDLKYKHNNMECLYSKGYNVRSFQTHGYAGKEPVLELRRNPSKSCDDFIADCKACNVSTDLSVDGSKPKNTLWEENVFTK